MEQSEIIKDGVIKSYEVKYTNTTEPRLTVTPTRVTIKMPQTGEAVHRTIVMLTIIAEEYTQTDVTVRGHLHNGELKMCDNAGNVLGIHKILV